MTRGSPSPWLLPALVLALVGLATGAAAHRLAPSLLEVTEGDAGRVDLIWKTPRLQPRGGTLEPILPARCVPTGTPRVERGERAVLVSWSAECGDAGLIGASFRVALFSQPAAIRKFPDWHAPLMAHLYANEQIATKEAARIWGTSDRTARTRLRKLVEQGHLAEVGTGPKDPKKVYVLKGRQDDKI